MPGRCSIFDAVSSATDDAAAVTVGHRRPRARSTASAKAPGVTSVHDEMTVASVKEDEQNVELLDLSKHILRLTEEVRSYGDTVEAERDQNEELLDLSRQTLALTREVHSFSGAARPADPGPSRRPDDSGPTR
jgi:hypothetical protein